MRKEKWLDEALRQIRFFPDRKKVRKELEEHLEDRIDEYAEMLEAGGMTAEYARRAAEEKAVSAMGDPRETGRQLNREHKPLLGFLWLGSCILVVVMLCVAIGVGFFLCKEKEYVIQSQYEPSDFLQTRDSYIENHYGENPQDMEYNVQVDWPVMIGDTELTFYNFIYDNRENQLVVLFSSVGPGDIMSRFPLFWCNETYSNGLGGRTYNSWEVKKGFYEMYFNEVNKEDRMLTLCYDFWGTNVTFDVDIDTGEVAMKEVQ